MMCNFSLLLVVIVSWKTVINISSLSDDDNVFTSTFTKPLNVEERNADGFSIHLAWCKGDLTMNLIKRSNLRATTKMKFEIWEREGERIYWCLGSNQQMTCYGFWPSFFHFLTSGLFLKFWVICNADQPPFCTHLPPIRNFLWIPP